AGPSRPPSAPTSFDRSRRNSTPPRPGSGRPPGPREPEARCRGARAAGAAPRAVERDGAAPCSACRRSRSRHRPAGPTRPGPPTGPAAHTPPPPPRRWDLHRSPPRPSASDSCREAPHRRRVHQAAGGRQAPRLSGCSEATGTGGQAVSAAPPRPLLPAPPGSFHAPMHEPRVLQEPELRPFLPLLYVAWADGDLSDAERALLCDRLTERPGLKPRLRDSLRAWLTVDGAPDSQTLATLHETLVQTAGTLGPEARGGWRSLAEAMARANGSSPETLAALDSVLDVVSADRAVLALPAEFPPDQTFQGPPRFDVEKLTALLDGPQVEARKRARAFLSDPDHRAVYGVDKETYRAITFARLEEVAALGMGRLTRPGDVGGERGRGPFFATFETMAFGDLSLVVLMGVQFGLWGGSVAALGSEAQKREWLPRIASLEAPGCFAMSEVGHGSNVADLETLAR